MKIVLCPDKFKGSLTARQVCDSLEKGLISDGHPLKIVKCPMADGGDGSIEILKSRLDLKWQNTITTNPLGNEIVAGYYYSHDEAYVELASASGLVLLNESERNPLYTTSKGTGILIKDALDRGFQKINLFVGGSSTNDGGIGLAQALGFEFLDSNDNRLDPIGLNLNKIVKVYNASPYDFSTIQIIVLCDVDNPMYGPNGAAYAYGAQKGATENEINLLDEGLRTYADILERQLSIDVSKVKGMGAAGAVGASLVGLLNATLENGFNFLSNITDLESAIKEADLVISGEGKIDQSSFQGKVLGNVLNLCNRHNVQCAIVGGIIDELDNLEDDFYFNMSILPLAKDINEAMKTPEKFLIKIGNEIRTLFL